MVDHPPAISGRETPLTAGLSGRISLTTSPTRDPAPSCSVDGWIAGAFGKGPVAFQHGWRSAGDATIDRAYGDFALVVHDPHLHTIWLARSPLSSRPLFYRQEGGEVRFSALAQEIAPRHSGIELGAIARWYGALVGSDASSMFDGVEKIEPGTIVRIDPHCRTTRRFWEATKVPVKRVMSTKAAASALREALEAAVGDAIDQGQHIASLLSSGRDSSCVSALAARYLRDSGRTLHCYTASPGSDPPFSDSHLHIDEAAGARSVAVRYPNIQSIIVTPRNVAFCEQAEAFARVHSAPLGNPISLHWWLEAQRQAAADGCDTMLTGGMGNLTISDGGPQYLADLMSGGHFIRWWQAACDVASFEGASWLNVTNISAGGLLPAPLYRLAQFLHSRRLSSSVSPYLGKSLRDAVDREHERQDQRPPRRSKWRGAELLDKMELGDVAPELMFGLRLLDPTADRRVVEAALSIPADMLVSRYDRRPIFELAFGDLLPETIVRAKRRAYQSMDWNFAYDLDELRAGFARYRRHAALAELLDFQAMERGLDRWPVGRLASLEETADLGEGLLRAFALAAFLSAHLPG